jgi:predicted metal-dependent phosphoesterase TrpH
MPKLDLHTHSQASADGSLRLVDYQTMLKTSGLGVIAITDHNRIDFALEAQAALGDRIIVGEEIMTSEGEIIGLYLTSVIKPGATALETAQAIKQQGGLVYVPHPFETLRSGVSAEALESITELVDIIETHNGRAVFQNFGKRAGEWARKHSVATSAASDAHGLYGWGRTSTTIAALPSKDTLVSLLQDHYAHAQNGTVGLRGLAYPKLNRLRKKASV